jgi:hypothetical protein
VAALLVTLGVITTRPVAQTSSVPADVASLLTRVGFTTDDLTSLQQGRVIAKTESSPELLEAAVVTAIRIATTEDRTLAYFHQLVSYVDGQVTSGYGTFQRPPRDSDIARLTLDSADLADLRTCQPTLCDVRVGAAAPDEISRAVDWSAPDAAERAAAWLRRTLAAYVAGYLERGAAGLRLYETQSAAVDLPPQWQAIFDRSIVLPALAPQLLRYLASFPTVPTPPEATDSLYWDQQHYTGLKPVIGLTHAVTWRDRSTPDRVIVAQRQFFATHYLYASLATTVFQRDRSIPSAPATYVVYFNRTRGDLLKGTQSTSATGLRGRLSNLGATLQRRVGEQMIKDSAERLLGAMKTALEQ